MFAAQYDPLYDDARLYSQALEQADTPSKFIEMKGMLHGFLLYPRSYGWMDIMLAIASFVGGRAVNDIVVMSDCERLRLARRPQLVVQRPKESGSLLSNL